MNFIYSCGKEIMWGGSEEVGPTNTVGMYSPGKAFVV